MTDIAAVRHSDPAIWRSTRHLPAPSGRTLAWIAIVTLAMFSLFPALDVATSKLFFVETPCTTDAASLSVCGIFPARHDPVLGHLRQALQAMPFIVALSLGIWVALRLLFTGRLDALGRAAATAFWTYVIAVGLVVNAGLKSFSGRPRPINTELFGGDLPFVPAGKITGYCASNCSFVSGETASAAWLLCLVPLLPPAWRMAGLAAAAGLLVLTGTMRLAFGAHYLSDVLIAVAVTLLVHRLLTMAAVRIHRARPEFGQETSAAAIAEGRAWVRQALEWPRRRESWR